MSCPAVYTPPPPELDGFEVVAIVAELPTSWAFFRVNTLDGIFDEDAAAVAAGDRSAVDGQHVSAGVRSDKELTRLSIIGDIEYPRARRRLTDLDVMACLVHDRKAVPEADFTRGKNNGLVNFRSDDNAIGTARLICLCDGSPERAGAAI